MPQMPGGYQMNTLAIDPGNTSGLAYFEHGVLIAGPQMPGGYQMNILAIDPGNTSGLAYFEHGVLIAACACSPDYHKAVSPDTRIVIECPTRVFKQATVASILHLSRCVGRYQERYSGHVLRLVAPHEWKGTIDGDIM